MNKRNGISLIIAFLIILSPLTVGGSLNQNMEESNLFINNLEGTPCPIHPINVTKKVWNPDILEWIDYYESELSEIVLFNITITYHKNCVFGCTAEQIQVIDSIPDGLEFEESYLYNESFINGSQIYWNLSEDYDVILYDDESVSILFEAYVSEYGLHDNYVEAFAFETGCNWDLYGDSEATIYGVPPDPSFEKKVKDPESGEWVEETFQYVTEVVTFKIELVYYGVYNLADIRIVDYLPDVTYYGNQASIEPSYVSDDGSIVWWNISDFIENDEAFVLTFDAYVWGRTGDCPDCGKNFAEYTAFENVTEKTYEGEDTAGILTDFYDDPELSYNPKNIDFSVQEQGWTGTDTFEIWNSGEQTLTYTISEDLDWIDVFPISGYSDGETDIITVSVVDTINMSGFYGGNINIFSNGGSGSIFVSIFIEEKEPTETELKISIKRGLCRSIKLNIENTGDEKLSNITWNITVSRRGLLKKTLLDINGTISSLESGGLESVRERLFGFGFIVVTVNVNVDGIKPFEETLKGFILFRFIRLRRFL